MSFNMELCVCTSVSISISLYRNEINIGKHKITNRLLAVKMNSSDYLILHYMFIVSILYYVFANYKYTILCIKDYENKMHFCINIKLIFILFFLF